MLNLRLALFPPLVQLLLEPLQILIPAASIRDDVVLVIRVLGNDGVIQNTAFLVQEHAERRAEILERLDAPRREELQKAARTRPRKGVLDHVTDVKQAALGTHVLM